MALLIHHLELESLVVGQAADQFEATLVWFDEEPLVPHRGYWIKLGTQTATATVQHPKYQINVNTLEHLAAPDLELNAVDEDFGDADRV